MIGLILWVAGMGMMFFFFYYDRVLFVYRMQKHKLNSQV